MPFRGSDPDDFITDLPILGTQMKISLVLPSNRISYTAIARVFEWSSLDADKFELIVRDNSEHEHKRTLLRGIESNTLKLLCVPQCTMGENWFEALRLATGEFVFCVSDDDWISVRGLQQLQAQAQRQHTDASIACFNGDYLVETSSQTGLFRYAGLDATEPERRLASYLDANATNFLYYSAVRRSVMTFCFDFLERLPYKFSYDDQLVSLLYLALGRVSQIQRVVYGYDLGQWETAGGTLAKDRHFYALAGLPIEYDRLHHLFCALEGALVLESKLLTEKIAYDPKPLADLWFRTMFAKFRGHNREAGYGENAGANAVTLRLKEKLLAQGQFDVHELLLDVCDAIDVCDADGAQRYFKFWSTL